MRNRNNSSSSLRPKRLIGRDKNLQSRRKVEPLSRGIYDI